MHGVRRRGGGGGGGGGGGEMLWKTFGSTDKPTKFLNLDDRVDFA